MALWSQHRAFRPMFHSKAAQRQHRTKDTMIHCQNTSIPVFYTLDTISLTAEPIAGSNEFTVGGAKAPFQTSLCQRKSAPGQKNSVVTAGSCGVPLDCGETTGEKLHSRVPTSPNFLSTQQNRKSQTRPHLHPFLRFFARQHSTPPFPSTRCCRPSRTGDPTPAVS
jgi:hypothetical protein